MATNRILPYPGEATWVTWPDPCWAIKMLHSAKGAPVQPENFIDVDVLRAHLRRVGLKTAHVGIAVGKYICYVWAEDRSEDPSLQRLLPRILKKHYYQHKGRPVVWTVK